MQTLALQQGIIYGPVQSRRLGRSLGINLLPPEIKICSFNCCYCQYGWTSKLANNGRDLAEYFPSVLDVSVALNEVFKSEMEFDYVTFSGNGEPTLHPQFPKIVEIACELRDWFRPNVKTALLSNSSTCYKPEMTEAINRLDLPIVKLDVGNERAFRKVNHGAPPVTLENIIKGIRGLNRYVIQSMFVRGGIDNSTDAEVATWIDKLQRLDPLWIQIYSLDRGTASRVLESVPKERLQEIASWAEEKTGVQVEVY